MPNIAKMLKDEIQRLARHEIKVAIAGLRKDNAVLKRTVADLKRRSAKLESVNKRLVAKTGAGSPREDSIPEDKVKSARISGRMIRSIRDRLGLSQQAIAKLMGVSSQAVYQWERKGGRLDLRGNNKARVVAIRSMGKREAKQRLAEMKKGR
jgi:DNA-binding transcriptional regulator YiaG